MNQNTEYELLAKEIYQDLINSQGITVDVQHNVKLEGRENQTHQIDVYWEYEIAGVKNKVAIECKNYNKLVSIGKVRDFYGVLADIGNINGIMISKKGFQSGAITYAKKYGINLKELRKPTDNDWQGRMRKITLSTSIIYPRIKSLNIVVDEEWVRSNFEIKKDDKFAYSINGLNNEIWITTSLREKIVNFLELQNQLPKETYGDNLVHDYHYDDGFIETKEYGWVKIKFIRFPFDLNPTKTSVVVIDAAETTKAILKDAIDGSIKFIRTF